MKEPTMDFETLTIEEKDGIALVTMDNPPVNATTQTLQAELTRAFDSFNDRDEVRVAVLTGKGRAFCAGADLKAPPLTEPGQRSAHSRTWRECTYAIMECRKPVIAAINGYALGGGLGLVASCDILVASTQAVLGLPEVDVGLLGGGRRAMRLFGHSRVRSLMFRAMRLNADELYRLGVVEAVVAPEELLPLALSIAAEIAKKDPETIRLAKLGLNTIEEMSLRDGYRFEQELTAELIRRKGTR
jgi:enoyl-CoA hydratase/carnithine racemase